jgi:2-polyprenyl-6-methoxyphenol hydroxylase-like FAD-dependent oxidoreductase
MATSGEHAVVLGASMAGLLAARVLADFYRTVTVVERDMLLPDTPANRRGVPQGKHGHVLMRRHGWCRQGRNPMRPPLLSTLLDVHTDHTNRTEVGDIIAAVTALERV